MSPALFLLNASGQDALQSSVSLDESIAAKSGQSSQPPDQKHIGPVAYTVGGYAGVSYDDNINGSQNTPESDVISRAGANLGFDWAATEQSQLQLGAAVGYLDYQKFTGNNGVEISPDSALTYAISLDEVVITLFDQFSYSREVRTEAALANVITLPQLDNNIGARAEWDPGHWTLTASYSHADYVSNHANDFLNRSSEYFFMRAGWRFAEATQAGLEASDGLTYYQVNGLSNNQNLSAGAYAEWQVRPSLKLTVRGGPVLYEPNSQNQSGGGSNFDTYYVSLEIDQQLTDFLSQKLSIDRSLQAGLNQGSSYIEQLSINYRISWALTSHISVGLSAGYIDGRQPLFVPFEVFQNVFVEEATTEDYQQFGGGLQASWQFTSHASLGLGFNHTQRDSNLSGRNYSDNSVSCQLNYNF